MHGYLNRSICVTGKSAEIYQGLATKTVTKQKGFTCLHTSKLNKTQTGVCSKESKGLLKEMAPRPETHVSDSQRPGSLMARMRTDYIQDKGLIIVTKGVGVVESIDWLGPERE